jgi:hypothetical protein
MTLLSYVKGLWTALLPAATKAKMENIEDGIKAASDILDLETDAGRALTQAVNAEAQRSALGLGDSATKDVGTGAGDVAAGNAPAAAQAAAEATAAGALAGHVAALDPHTQYAKEADLGDSASKNVGTGAGDVAAGNAPAGAVTTHESTYAHANLPTAAGKTAADAIGAASGADTTQKLSTLISGSATGYTHLTKLAAAEAETALWDYDTAAKMPPALLREIVEAASGGAATVKVDDLGYPSMMYIIRGPIMAEHLHTDMGSVSALKTAVIAAAGTGYTANDILTIAGGTGGTVRALTVGASGEVTSIVIANPGTGYSAATGAATTGGTGTGCTITTTIGPVHNAFSVAGVTKTEILIGMFLSAQHGSGASARAVSWPGLYPTGALDFDAAKALHTAKNGGVAGGWHLMSYWEQALVTWLSMKMNTEPRGNTYYGRAHDSGYEYECGVRSDGLAPGTASGTAKHRNGSGPDSWSHNAKRWGIHDLVGSLAEWRDGMKIVDGLIRMPLDNDFTLAEESWPSTGVYFDNTTAESGGAPRLSNAVANALADPNSSSVAHKDMTLTAGFDGLDLVVRQRMLRANLAPKIASSGAAPFAPKGTLYLRNYGERLPLCGGHWSAPSTAGLGYLNLRHLRSHVSDRIGSRAAFISLS